MLEDSRESTSYVEKQCLSDLYTSELHMPGAAKPGDKTAQGAGDQMPSGFSAGKMPGASGGAAPAAPDTAARVGSLQQGQQP